MDITRTILMLVIFLLKHMRRRNRGRRVGMFSVAEILYIALRLGCDVVLDQVAVAVCVLQKPHLELVDLEGKFGYAV